MPNQIINFVIIFYNLNEHKHKIKTFLQHMPCLWLLSSMLQLKPKQPPPESANRTINGRHKALPNTCTVHDPSRFSGLAIIQRSSILHATSFPSTNELSTTSHVPISMHYYYIDPTDPTPPTSNFPALCNVVHFPILPLVFLPNPHSIPSLARRLPSFSSPTI